MADEKRERIERMIEAYRAQAEERGKELLQQHREWRDRGKGRDFVSPLGGVAQPVEPKPQAPPNLQPKKANWW